MTVSRLTTLSGVRPPPIGLRFAAILCVAIGFYAGLERAGTSAAWLAGHQGARAWTLLLTELLGDLLLLAAGVLIWLRRRAGVGLIFASLVLPAMVRFFLEIPMRGPGWPLVLALVLIAANIRRLR